MKRSLTIALALGFLTACGGGGGGSTTPSGSQTASQSAKTSKGTVTLSIPLAGATQSSAKVRYPQFVSPNADSVALVINGGTPQIFDVTPTSPLCVTGSMARTCTLAFGAPAGSDTFDFLIYLNPNAQGALLASTQVTQTIAAGAAFNFVVAMNAVIGTVVANVPTNGGTQGNCPDSQPNFNGISEGCPGSSGAITFAVFDPSGAQVTGTAPFVTPILISTNDPSVTSSPTQITAPGQTAVLTYSGATLGAAITNSLAVNLTVGTVVIPASVQVRRSYLYVANSNAAPGTTPTGGGNVAVYKYGATGAATPVRTITNSMNNPVQPLLDSSGNLWVLDNGPYTTHSNPVINVYPPGGSVPFKQITNIAAVAPSLYDSCETMAFTPDGSQLYVTCDDGAIHVFPTNFTSAVTAASLQTVSMTDDSWSGPEVGMAFDQSGNLYVADTGFNTIDQYNVSGLPTSGSYVPIGASYAIQASFGAWNTTINPLVLQVDNTGTLYASIIYYNSTMGAPDANNMVGVWKTTTLPCNNCTPSAQLMNGFMMTHAPAGIGFDPAGNLYVSNPFNNSINVIAKSVVANAVGLTTIPAPIQTINTGASPGAPNGFVVGP